MRLESALNGRRECRSILVGSSLSGRLDSQWLEPSVTSLAVSGSGAETGLQLTRILGTPPAEIVIELNYLFRPAEAGIVEYFDGSPLARLRRRIPAAWQYNHPLNLLLSLQKAWKARKQGGVASEIQKPRSEEIFQFAWKQRLEFGAAPPDHQAVDEACVRLGSWIKELRARGTKVSLAWFPIDPAIAETPGFRVWREAYRQAFPPDRHHWIEFPAELGLHTVDGEHLEIGAARQVAAILVEKTR